MSLNKITASHIHARARSSVGELFKYLYPLAHQNRPVKMSWYIDAMSEAMMAMHRGEYTRLIINAPPHHTLPATHHKSVYAK